MKVIKGKSVFAGIAIGKVVVWSLPEISEKSPVALGDASHWERYLEAKQLADKQLEKIYETTKAEIGETEADIIDVQRMMLEDGDFNEAIEGLITNQNKDVISAVEQVGEQFESMFSALDDEYMKARALDVSDISKRLVRILSGHDNQIKLTEPSILIADDLTPSETLQLDRSKILAFVTRKGSANSHTAILAGVLNIPSLIQVPIEIDTKLNGLIAIVDGIGAQLYLDPDKATIEKFEKSKQEQESEQLQLEALRGLPSTTKSGQNVEIFANIGSASDIDSVIKGDAEGIGLFRSEFLYLERSDYPSEEDQYNAYSKVVKAMNGKKVVIRTLDIGADKKVDYFGLQEEENPALGFRAIRICLERPELFKTQLRAIYRAAVHGNVSVMFPMITSVWEVKESKKIANEVQKELEASGIPFGKIELGIMIETPAAVLVADELAKEVEFFSVGTNDLTQYTLAVDRQSSNLERFYDPHHPAIIKMLEIIASTAIKNNIWAGICGELGADEKMTEKFLEMGYTELSVSPSHVLKIRNIVRNIN